MRSFIRPVLAAMVLAAMPALPAAADDVDAATQSALHDIITRQLDAFAHDDADTAESFASPGIKAMFPDPKDFVAMVRKSYAPLLSPRSTEFAKSGTTARGPMQAVTIVDKDGAVWTAVYSFEQVDGAWRINGCVLIKAEATSI